VRTFVGVGIIVAACSFCWPFAFAQQSQDRETFEKWQSAQFSSMEVSLPPSFKLTHGERIQGFRCLILGGVVQRIYTPYEWDMTIDNSSTAVGNRTELKADFAVGAAAFSNDRLGYFNNFMTVASLKEPSPPEIKVELSIETEDGLLKKVKFNDKQLVLRPTGGPFHNF
jgi:hypothetical protein